jgi:antitoxin VapB
MEFRFEGTEVFVRRDPRTGDVILSHKPDTWDGLFALYKRDDAPADFLTPEDRKQTTQDRDPSEGWEE